MARITIDMPKEFSFSTEIQVCMRDINAANHLGSDALLAFLNEALLRLFAAKGFSGGFESGISWIITDQATIYKSEGFHGDMLLIEMSAADFYKYGCDIVYRVTNKTSAKVLAEAKTGIMFFNYEERKPAFIPDNFKAAFNTA